MVALKVIFLISHMVLLLFSETATDLSNIMASLYKGSFLGQERTNLDEVLSISQSPDTVTSSLVVLLRYSTTVPV